MTPPKVTLLAAGKVWLRSVEKAKPGHSFLPISDMRYFLYLACPFPSGAAHNVKENAKEDASCSGPHHHTLSVPEVSGELMRRGHMRSKANQILIISISSILGIKECERRGPMVQFHVAVNGLGRRNDVSRIV